MTRSDVDEVIRTLADNNAYTIADNIEGEDKFGKQSVWRTCAELKSLLIDLEGQEQADRAQAA